MATKRIAVTTVDNPYNPIKDFDNWYRFDTEKGYGTCEFLARLVQESGGLPEKINNMALEEAIDEMVRENIGPVEYLKVTE